MMDLKYYVALSQFPKIGPKRFQLLKNHFPTVQEIWNASLSELRMAGMEPNLAEELALKRRQINPDQEMEKLEKENVQAVTLDDPRYPALLKEIHNPPYLLYYKGDLKNFKTPALAVVGTRRISNYGKQITPQITAELLAQNFIIVSGLALGVDGLAHLTAVKLKKTTVAVLGSGLDKENIYPSLHRRLAEEIVQNQGIIFSEYPLGMPPLKHNFPPRNRVIAGLTLGTLIIEADENSGALITAQYALDQNREVFAIPGPISNPQSQGPNQLIKKGAKLVQNAQDILEELNIQQIQTFRNNQEIIPDSAEEATLLKCLSNEPKHINELVRVAQLSMAEINATILKLEMKGRVRNLGNMTYIKSLI